MKKFNSWHPLYYRMPFDSHEKIKSHLLTLIQKAPYNTMLPGDPGDKYRISFCDWENSNDLKRPWVAFFLPYFHEVLKEFMNHNGFSYMDLQEMWFQRYNKNDEHGFHLHQGHFSGVYYLEFDKSSPKTEFIHPLTRKVEKIKAKEGDIVVFPSFLNHRAPLMKSDKSKTIISWNFQVRLV
tara:strand:- start:590 stop:1132 length:543 start_codon:yes stop_codon:yes gene_type:complete